MHVRVRWKSDRVCLSARDQRKQGRASSARAPVIFALLVGRRSRASRLTTLLVSDCGFSRIKAGSVDVCSYCEFHHLHQASSSSFGLRWPSEGSDKLSKLCRSALRICWTVFRLNLSCCGESHSGCGKTWELIKLLLNATDGCVRMLSDGCLSLLSSSAWVYDNTNYKIPPRKRTIHPSPCWLVTPLCFSFLLLSPFFRTEHARLCFIWRNFREGVVNDLKCTSSDVLSPKFCVCLCKNNHHHSQSDSNGAPHEIIIILFTKKIKSVF